VALDTSITLELRESIGRSVGPIVFEVERGAIRRFAEAVGDPNPLYRDEDYARRMPQGGVVAPPGFFGWPLNASHDILETLKAFHCPFKRVLNGGTDCEFFRAVRPGDMLAATRRLIDVSEKESRLGRLIILVIETTYLNQAGECVAVNRDTTITY
jgi:acyl dehydratase